MGALAGAILDKEHPLAGAIKGGIGAMIGEVIAESLVDRQQIQNQVIQELELEQGRPLSQEDKVLFEAAYREKLHPAMNTAKLVVASVMASFGHDPSIAIATAANALENNFAGVEDYFIYREIPEEYRVAMNEAIVEVMEDIRRNPQTYREEAAIAATPYGDILRRVANGENVSALEFGIETGLTFLPMGKIVEAGVKTGGKVFGKFAAAVTKKLEKNGAKGVHPLANTHKDKIGNGGYFTRKAERAKEYEARVSQPSKKAVNYKTSNFQKGDKIDLDRFTQRMKEGNWKDPKTGEILSPNRNPTGHGGSAWKLFKNEKAIEKGEERLATFAADGTFLRK